MEQFLRMEKRKEIKKERVKKWKEEQKLNLKTAEIPFQTQEEETKISGQQQLNRREETQRYDKKKLAEWKEMKQMRKTMAVSAGKAEKILLLQNQNSSPCKSSRMPRQKKSVQIIDDKKIAEDPSEKKLRKFLLESFTKRDFENLRSKIPVLEIKYPEQKVNPIPASHRSTLLDPTKSSVMKKSSGPSTKSKARPNFQIENVEKLGIPAWRRI